MKIAIIDHSWEYNIDTPYNEPLGGTQSAICYFLEELAKKNHNVYLFNNIKKNIEIRRVKHIPYSNIIKYISENEIIFDIIIVSCLSDILFKIKNIINNFNTLFCLWTGHDIDQDASLLLKKNVYKDAVDLFIFVSEWQRKRYIDYYNINYNKTIIMRNGIGKPFEKKLLSSNNKIINSMAYCSIPWRGLLLLKDIFININNIYQDSTLNIYSGLNIYKQNNDINYENEFNNIRNVNFNIGISQNKLADELENIEYLTYPNIFQETSCITILQAMACGCIIITSDLGALKETMNNTNYYIDININNINLEEYKSNFIYKLHNIINMNNNLKNELRNNNKNYIKNNYLWSIICDKFINEIDIHINNKINYIKNESIDYINKGFEYFKNNKWIKCLEKLERIQYFSNIEIYSIIKLNIGVCYYKLNNYNISKLNFKSSKKINKNFNIYRNLAILELENNNTNKYLKYARCALKYNFDIIFANLLAEKTETIGLYNEAESLYKSILTLDPNNVNSLNNLGNLYLLYLNSSKDIDNDMIITYHKSYEICDKLNEFRKKELVYSNILFNNLYNWNLSEEEIFNRSMSWSEHFPKQMNMINIANKLNRNIINIKIRVGYISTDFITHPVGYMFESILQNHNINNFELFCYDNSFLDENEDVIAKRLRSYNNATWHKINLLSDEDTLKLIINDELDILIDMMGHTRNTRINILQYKPAKVLISYFAYPGTTGVKEIDYKFTDIYANPPETQKYSIEKFYYLPNGFQCYTPPIVLNTCKRYNRDKYKINLCCFNNPIKLSKPTIDIFIKILKKLPQAKLFLRYLYYKSSFYRAYILKIFTDAGIEEDRIDIALLPIQDCLDLYNDMDIVLDPFPYNGGTISSEALYMNTPIITLAGTNYVSRIGVSLLSNLNLEKYIAYSHEEYIEKVIELANNEDELKKLHITIRNKMLKTDLGDSNNFTKNIENAYIDIMKKYHK